MATPGTWIDFSLLIVESRRTIGKSNRRARGFLLRPYSYNTADELDRLVALLGATSMTQLSHRIAVYTGTFDPIHRGHLDIISRGSLIFDQLIVGVGINPDKQTFFDQRERVALVRAVIEPYPNVSVRPFTSLAVTFVREVGARVMLRGLRTTSDMENEFTMSLMNLNLDAEIETVFLMAKEAYSHVSSTLLRQIATFGGRLDKFLPPEAKAALEARVRERQGERPA